MIRKGGFARPLWALSLSFGLAVLSDASAQSQTSPITPIPIPAQAPEIVNAVSLARTAETAKDCAPRSFSRTATMTRPVRLRRMPATPANRATATASVSQ